MSTAANLFEEFVSHPYRGGLFTASRYLYESALTADLLLNLRDNTKDYAYISRRYLMQSAAFVLVALSMWRPTRISISPV